MHTLHADFVVFFSVFAGTYNILIYSFFSADE
jgi:hypothetical protein